MKNKNAEKNILIIEDAIFLWKLFDELFKKIDGFTPLFAKSLAEGANILKKTDINAILLDLNLPDSNGINTFHTVNQAYPNIPIVINTNIEDEKMALQAIRAGAQDYLLKDQCNYFQIKKSIEYAIERKNNEILQKEQTTLIESFLHNIHAGILVENTNRETLHINETFCEMFDITKSIEKCIGKSASKYIEGNRNLFAKSQKYKERVQEILSEKQKIIGEQFFLKDGRILERDFIPMYENQKFTGFLWLFRDVTKTLKNQLEKDSIEKQLIQSQKMETIGHLVKGITESFSHSFVALSGYLHLLRKQTQEDNEFQKTLDKITTVANKAKQFTNQLSTFSKSGNNNFKVSNINKVIHDTKLLMSKSLQNSWDIELDLAPELWNSNLNASQIVQALINIITSFENVAESQPTVTIATKNIIVNDSNHKNYKVTNGNYVRLTIQHNQNDSVDKLLEKILNQNYNNEKIDQNEYLLRLSVAYSIIKNHDGTLNLDSNPQSGTLIDILIPACSEKKKSSSTSTDKVISIDKNKFEKKNSSLKNSTVLVVDDDELVTLLLKDVLKDRCKNVLTSSNGIEALDLLRVYHQNIDYIIMDISLPIVTGIEISKIAQKINPKIKILFISGYTHFNNVIYDIFAHNQINFLQKPFKPEQLLESIQNFSKTNVAVNLK